MDHDRPNTRRRKQGDEPLNPERRMLDDYVNVVLTVLFLTMHVLLQSRIDAVITHPMMQNLHPDLLGMFVFRDEHGRNPVPTLDDPAFSMLLVPNRHNLEQLLNVSEMYQHTSALLQFRMLRMGQVLREPRIRQFRLDTRLAETFFVPRHERWFVMPLEYDAAMVQMSRFLERTGRFPLINPEDQVWQFGNAQPFFYPDDYRMTQGDLMQYINLVPYIENWMNMHPRIDVVPHNFPLPMFLNYYSATMFDTRTTNFFYPTIHPVSVHLTHFVRNGIPVTGGLSEDTTAARHRQMDALMVYMWVQQTVNTINVRRRVNRNTGRVGRFITEFPHILYRFLFNFIEAEIGGGRHFLAGATVLFTRQAPHDATGIMLSQHRRCFSMVIAHNPVRYDEFCQRILRAIHDLTNI